MAYTTIDDPSAYFQTALYSGNSGTQSITNDGNSDLQPDWVWIKQRSGTQNHNLQDSVRGSTKIIKSNTNADETTDANGVTSFNTDGFSIGTRADINQSGTYVAWQWKAGTSFTNDASSTSVGSIDSSGSVSTTAGFSIISWTGSGSGATIAHGLGAQPQIVFVKNRDDTASWNVYTVIGGGGKGLFLNDAAAFDSDSTYFNGGTASTTTFPVGTANTANGSSDNMIAYCFANVKGYSKIGSYTGNGNADGPMIVTGFSPAFLMIKQTAASNDWFMIDNKREPFNPNNVQLVANDTGSSTNKGDLDLLSNGFKPRSSNAAWNENNAQYIYMAFAENPFVTSTGVPATAR